MKIKIKNTKAAILKKLKYPLSLGTINLPKNLKKNQLLVELTHSGICGSQIGEIDGVKGPDKYLPHLLGHEGIGYVIQTGPKVKKVKEGDKVLLHWMKSGGDDSAPPIYNWNDKRLNAGLVTTFNQHAIVSQTRVTKIINNFNDLDLLMMGCTASTAIGSIKNLCNIKPRHIIAVSGCGPIGLYIIKVLRLMNVKDIVAIDINNSKLNLAKKLGAKFVLNTSKQNLSDLKKLFSNGFDYLFECTGNTKIISQGFECLKKDGSEILIGVPKHKKKSSFYTLEINLGKKLIGSKGGNFNPDKDISSYLKLLNLEGKDKKKIIKNIIKLEDINDLINETKKGNIIGKSVIVY